MMNNRGEMCLTVSAGMIIADYNWVTSYLLGKLRADISLQSFRCFVVIYKQQTDRNTHKQIWTE
jgi:hypothetical protein